VISGGIGLFVEREISQGWSVLVFLILFFSNFVISWIGVILVMDGTLKDAQGRQSQLDTERAGRASIATRRAQP
jgi:hypothetical protein